MLPPALATAAFAAASMGLEGLALWLGLLAVPAAGGVAFVSVSDMLEGRPALLRASTSALALGLLVLGCAVRSNAAAGAATPRLATWALLAALLTYSVPVVAWVLEPVKVTRRQPRSRRRVVEAEEEVLSRAA